MKVEVRCVKFKCWEILFDTQPGPVAFPAVNYTRDLSISRPTLYYTVIYCKCRTVPVSLGTSFLHIPA